MTLDPPPPAPRSSSSFPGSAQCTVEGFRLSHHIGRPREIWTGQGDDHQMENQKAWLKRALDPDQDPFQ